MAKLAPEIPDGMKALLADATMGANCARQGIAELISVPAFGYELAHFHKETRRAIRYLRRAVKTAEAMIAAAP